MRVHHGINFGCPHGSGFVCLTNVSQRVGRETAISALGADDLVSPALAAAADADGERPALDALEAYRLDGRLHQFPGQQGGLGIRTVEFEAPALTMAVVPFAALMLVNRPSEGVRPIAESVFAGVLVACALFMGFNEGGQNWQSLWTCAVYLGLALTLWRARAVQIPIFNEVS